MVTTSLQSFEGSVGIGTDNPSKTLHVEGNVHITEDLNILGNILIQGETTTVETTNLNIQDPIIELGKNNSLGTDLGIIMTRPGSNVAVSFLEASDELVMAYTESHSGVSSVVPITSEDLKLKVYGELTTTGNVVSSNLTTGNINAETVTTNVLIMTGEGNPFVPSGVIVMWSGTIATVPTGWYLCDGQNGTPNLLDRFIVGAGNLYSMNDTGGSSDAVVVSHTHTGSTATGGAHSHSWSGSRQQAGVDDGNNQRQFSKGDNGGSDTVTRPTTTHDGHVHAMSLDNTGVSGTNANLPPYFALAYIMKS
jgi:microcystin-dependent protein